MAFYALIAKKPADDTWRTCAIFANGSIEAAARNAIQLRDSGVLAFVPKKALFRIRNASRSEMALMQSYLSSFGNENALAHTGADFSGFLRRRQDLLSSFFLALYTDPQRLLTRYMPNGVPKGSASPSGGVEIAEPEQEEAASETEAQQSDLASEAEGSDTLAGETAEQSPDLSDQEKKLAMIASSAEANSGGDNIEIDLGMM